MSPNIEDLAARRQERAIDEQVSNQQEEGEKLIASLLPKLLDTDSLVQLRVFKEKMKAHLNDFQLVIIDTKIACLEAEENSRKEDMEKQVSSKDQLREKLLEAIQHNDTTHARKLLEGGVELDSNQLSPLLTAVSHGNTNMVELFLEYQFEPNVYDKNGNTPLHLAAAGGYYDILTMLLARRAEPNLTNKSRINPLHLAVIKNFYNIAELLLVSHACVDAREENGFTPLHLAVAGNYSNLVNLLLDHKANPYQVDEENYSPLMYAKFLPASSSIKAMFLKIINKGNWESITKNYETGRIIAERIKVIKDIEKKY